MHTLLQYLVAEAYDNVEEGFYPSESSLSVHNRSVKTQLVKNIISGKFSKDKVKHALQRKYEQVRRQWAIDQKENGFELIEAKAKESHYRARGIRKYQNRSLVSETSRKNPMEPNNSCLHNRGIRQLQRSK